jgi:hypothetical protein
VVARDESRASSDHCTTAKSRLKRPPTPALLAAGMPWMSHSPEFRSSRRVRQETQVEAITARLRRDRTGGHNPADGALACSPRSDKMGVVRVDFRTAAADLQGRRAAPKKPRRTGISWE